MLMIAELVPRKSAFRIALLALLPAAAAWGGVGLACPGSGPQEVGLAFSDTCSVVGGSAPFSFSISAGSLPAGVGISSDATTVTISGTPTTAGGFSYTLKVTDSASQTGTHSTSGSIAPGPSISTGSLAGGQVGVAYGQTISAGGGVGCCTFSIQSGGVPGLSLSSGGNLSGTPTSAGTFSLVVSAMDANGAVATRALSVTISAPLFSMSCDSTAGPSEVGQSYSTSCVASGGTPPVRWVTGGSLPPGLSLISPTGSNSGISGKATTAGSYSYSIQASDSVGANQSVSFNANIVAGVTIGTGSLPATVVGAAYNQTLQASGGTKPITWSIAGGSPPSGISLSGSGVLSGTPSAPGTFNFTVKASDAVGSSATQALSIAVGANVLTAAPAQLSFTLTQGGSASPQSVSVFSTAPTSFTAAASGSFLTVSPSSGQTPGSVTVSVNAASLTPNTYTGSITFSANGAAPAVVQVTLQVQAPPPTQLIVSPGAVSTSVVANSGPVTNQFAVSNPGSQPVPFSVQVVQAAPWLSLNTSSGTAAAGGAPAIVSFSLNPQNLNPGTYSTTLQVSGTGVDPQSVGVSLLVSSQSLNIVLSQTGLQFTGVTQGIPPASATFAILNGGLGTLPWNLAVATYPLGSPNTWLTVSPLTGSSVAGSASITPVTVSVDPSKLTPGQYFGTITVTAAGASNSPQQVVVVFNVLAVGQTPPPLVLPSGVIFVGDAGGANPQPSLVTLSNAGAGSVSYASTVTTDDNLGWLSRSPTSGIVNPGAPATLALNANTAGLSAGIRFGTVRVAFSDATGTTVRDVRVALVLASPAGSSPASGPDRESQSGRDANGCDSSVLALIPKGLVQASANLTVLQPALLQMQEMDCSKSNVTTGTVAASFAYADGSKDTLLLTSTNSGQWEGSWTPPNRGPVVNVTVTGISIVGVTTRVGTATFSVNIVNNPNKNVANPTTVFNNATSASPTAIVAPGSYITIKGDQLSDTTEVEKTSPFPNVLGNTQVQLGGLTLPLYFVSPAQINALVPFGVSPNANQALTVIREASSVSTLTVGVADAQPGIYSVNNQGFGQGSVLIAGTATLAEVSRPAKRGEFIEIFCTGLGKVNPTPTDGTPSPSAEPLARTVNAPTVMIGGVPATVNYSGLAPGLVGLYQVNAQVPATVTPGNAVSLSLTIGNPPLVATSNTVTIAVQ